ncbi:hypothetical protein E2562_004160 [Oryza meyeriana var. granulata]|uniref:Uncharacterized protein n=1 Tax=Oryza meyeriana var. granulata TaxID=110450 RepID=A0A6G1BT82_9ORYZ|nr:hypothetical protein E2562_004160 [Oryza meyeriana var. granulata]
MVRESADMPGQRKLKSIHKVPRESEMPIKTTEHLDLLRFAGMSVSIACSATCVSSVELEDLLPTDPSQHPY